MFATEVRFATLTARIRILRTAVIFFFLFQYKSLESYLHDIVTTLTAYTVDIIFITLAHKILE